MSLRPLAPVWGLHHPFSILIMVACVCALGAPASGQPGKRGDKSEKAGAGARTSDAEEPDAKGPIKKPKYDFDGISVGGNLRAPQLLYFLERASEELERASLEKRSFIPHMVRSLEEEAL